MKLAIPLYTTMLALAASEPLDSPKTKPDDFWVHLDLNECSANAYSSDQAK